MKSSSDKEDYFYRRIRTRKKEKDQSVKKFLICLNNSLKIFSVIILFSSATADDGGRTNHSEICRDDLFFG